MSSLRPIACLLGALVALGGCNLNYLTGQFCVVDDDCSADQFCDATGVCQLGARTVDAGAVVDGGTRPDGGSPLGDAGDLADGGMGSPDAGVDGDGGLLVDDGGQIDPDDGGVQDAGDVGDAGANDDHVIAYWSFDADENAAGGEPPLVMASDSFVAVSGAVDSAARFVTGRYFTYASIDLAMRETMTVMLWARTEAAAGEAHYIFRQVSGSDQTVALIQNGAGFTLHLEHGDDNGYVSWTGYDAEGADGRWHHYAFIFDGARNQDARATLIVDGVQRDDVTTDNVPVTLPPFETSPPFEISVAGSDGWVGAIDELSFWSTAFTPAEVAAAFDQGTPPGLPAPLDNVRLFSFDSDFDDVQGRAMGSPFGEARLDNGVDAGGALWLGEVRDWADLGIVGELEDAETFAVSLWVRPRNLSGDLTLLHLDEDPVTLGLIDNGARVRVDCCGASVQTVPLESLAFQEGVWTHVGLSFDFGVVEFYIDGHPVPMTGGPLANSLENVAPRLFAGRPNTDTGVDIDELILFDRVLQRYEMTALYDAFPPPPKQPPSTHNISFDNNLNASSGPGELNGTITYVDGVSNAAADFNLGARAAYTTVDVVTGTDDFTISTWMKRSTNAGTQRLFGVQSPIGDVRAYTTASTFHLNLGASATITVSPFENAVPLQQWHLLTINYRGGTEPVVRITVDDVDQVVTIGGTLPSEIPASPSAGPFLVGLDAEDTWKGALDEMMFFDRSLTLNETVAVYEAHRPREPRDYNHLWRLGGGINDSVPGGTCTSDGAEPTYTPGPRGTAAVFTTTSGVDCGPIPSMYARPEFSWSFWGRLDDPAPNILAPMAAALNGSYDIGAKFVGDNILLEVGNGEDTRRAAPAFAGPRNDGQWHHYAFVFDGAKTPELRGRIFLDGQELATDSDGTPDLPSTTPDMEDASWYLSYPAGGRWPGAFDHVAVHYRALRSAEIEAMYRAGEP